jgi:hypothetical protein
MHAMLRHLATYPKATPARLIRSRLVYRQTYPRKLDTVPLRPNLQSLPYSTGGYGDSDGNGDPLGKNPASQGVNRRTREIEHPGPSPPDTRSANSKSSDPSMSSSKPTKANEEKIPPRSSKEEFDNEKKREAKRG